MLSLIISLVFGLVVCFGIGVNWPGHWGWCSFFGFLGFILCSLPLNFWIKKKLEAIFKDVQDKIVASQTKLKREAQMYQSKGIAGKATQEKIEAKQAASIHEAIDMLDAVNPLRKWNFLAGKQADTLRAQLLYQIKEYEAADPYLEKALVMDPLILAMKMVRKYKKGDLVEVEKMYNKGIKRFKGDKTTLIYALYSWILVKENKLEEAVVVLDEGKKKTENEVLKTNWEHVVNNRIKRFSNAGLGDNWYVLALEEVKPIKQRAQLPFGGSPKYMH